MVSSTRCAASLYFGRPVVAEPHPLDAPWNRVVTFAKSVDQFYEQAISATLYWNELHRHQLDRFERVLTPEVCIGEPLKRIGIT